MKIESFASKHLPITKTVYQKIEVLWLKKPLLKPVTALAFVIAAVVTPIFVLMDLIRNTYRYAIRKTPMSDHHYHFSSPVSTNYEQGLKNFVSEEIKQNNDLIRLPVVQKIQSPVKNKESYHKTIVLSLRETIDKKDTLDSKSKEFIEKLSHWIYTGANLLPSMTEWLESNLTKKEKDALNGSKPLHTLIGEIHIRMKSTAKFQGEVFPDHRPYDPRLLGDTPSHFFHLGETQIIRTPAVTREKVRTSGGILKESMIVEEFESYLDHTKNLGQKHLYVNLMTPRFDSEKIRNRAIEDLEKRRSDVFDLITLSKDCPLYRQEGKYKTVNDAKTFKESFINTIFDIENRDFHFPISWDREEVKKICKQAIEIVHTDKFDSNETLDLNERKAFIELSYTKIIESLILNKKPNTCNVSCRSCIDRGAGSLALLYAETQKNSPEYRKLIATIALTPAIFAQSRTMLPDRHERFYKALEAL